MLSVKNFFSLHSFFKLKHSCFIKKAEGWRIDAFELWCWKRLLRVPWTARRSNQSILKAIIPGCSLEGLMLKLTLQYFGHLMWRIDSLEKTLMLGKIEGRRRRGWPRMRWLDGITNSMDMNLSGDSGSWWWTGRPGVLWFMGLQSVGHDWATELNWTFFSGILFWVYKSIITPDKLFSSNFSGWHYSSLCSLGRYSVYSMQ